MRRIAISVTLAVGFSTVFLLTMSVQAGVFDHIWPSSNPPTLTDVARMIDCIQEPLVNKGTVSVKQPDIWSQGRMTKFRKEFEDQMSGDIGKFLPMLAAKVARSDYASFQSQTSLAASISPVAPGTSLNLPDLAAVQKERDSAVALLNSSPNAAGSSSTFPAGITAANPAGSAVAGFSYLQSTSPSAGATPTSSGLTPSGMPFGLEPNVVEDQKADYITHVQRLRRINLGDDNSDSAGYALYLMRVPISIQPGDKTKKGFGALVNLTINHDFGPRFLPATYRNLVVYDLVDQLAPVIHELIRTRKAMQYNEAVWKYLEAKRRREAGSTDVLNEPSKAQAATALSAAQREDFQKDVEKRGGDLRQLESDMLIRKQKLELIKITNVAPVSRLGPRTYAIAPSDVQRVFVSQNLLNLAYSTQEALNLVPDPMATGTPPMDLNRTRMTEVRSYLRHELESAYDLMEGRCKQDMAMLADCEFIDSLADMVYCRKFEGPKGATVDSDRELNDFYTFYESFTQRLPGNLRFRPVGVLCWAIAIQAGLLNRQLREDMKQTKGPDGWVAPAEVDAMDFYVPEPQPEVEHCFEQYVRARWPMITFALDPNVDQQNIEDAFSRRRDMQLAIAFALTSGRLSFRQAINYQRQLQYEAQTIALNQTVAAFANGNDTFGWRISPRYQTPPEESNIRAVTNMLLRGGPGPNYQLANSKIEPGMREMTAVVVMPSFVRSMRIDISSDWFRLSDPDERKIHTAQAVELGRKINEARQCLDLACKCAMYRPEDVARLRAKLHQLETMLPLQTSFVKVPYENTLGGFALFTQGATALVPELDGYEGVEYADLKSGCDVLLYGKHFSLYETAIVVGGRNVPMDGAAFTVGVGSDNKPLVVNSSFAAMHDANGNIPVTKQDGTLSGAAVPDPGCYSILSREIIRLRIPPNVLKNVNRSDGSSVIEVYVATPNGISNKLAIPLQPARPEDPRPVFSSMSQAPVLSLADSNLTARVKFTPGTTPRFDLLGITPTRLRIVPNDRPAPTAPRADLRLLFQLPGTTTNKLLAEVVIPRVPLDPMTGGYTIPSEQLAAMVTSLIQKLGAGGVALSSDLLVQTKRIEVQLAASAGDPSLPPLVPTTNPLSLSFELVLASRRTVPANDLAAGSNVSGRTAVGVAAPRDPAMRQTSAESARVDLQNLPPLPGETSKDEEITLTQILIPAPSPPTALSQPESAAGTPDPGINIPIPGGSIQVPGAGGNVQLPGSGGSLHLPGTVRIPLPGGQGTVEATGTVELPLSDRQSTSGPPSQTLVVTPRQPAINVTVPITNIAKQPRSSGLLHRNKAPISPQNPTRPPLMERMLNRP